MTDKPTALETLHIKIPTQLPIDDKKAALAPPTMD
jgi:hypothetical protein